MLPDALLLGVGGAGASYASIEGFTGITVSDYNGLFAPLIRDVENVKIPYRDGEVGFYGTFAAYDFEVPLVVGGITGSTMGDRRASMISQLSGIAALVAYGLFPMRRRLVIAGGSYVEHESNGQYRGGLQPERLNADNGRCVLQFRNLDGYWRVPGTTTAVFP